jgi:hypothetical protein
MGLAVDHLAFVSAVAAEIDRLVVSGHERAAESPDKPPAVAQMKAFPQLLSTAAILLLEQPLTRADVTRIVPYAPSKLIDGLIDNNISEGVVSEHDAALVLTDRGRAAAEGVVTVQESAVGVWASAGNHIEVVERLLTQVVQRARTLEPPRMPSNFALFAAVCERSIREGRVLRLITSVRYWRADAHGRALAEADLRPFEAHALNRLWDAHRGVDRVGQGFAEPGRNGVASLEARGLAHSGAITAEGIEFREEVERKTDDLTAPIYDALDELSREQLLGAISALPDR